MKYLRRRNDRMKMLSMVVLALALCLTLIPSPDQGQIEGHPSHKNTQQQIDKFLDRLVQETRNLKKSKRHHLHSRDQIISMIKFPLRVSLGHERVTVGPRQFRIHFNQIFNDKVTEAILEWGHRPHTSFQLRGLSLKNGALWVSLSGDLPEPEAFFITAINNG